jgi:adenylate cyclase class 2
MLEIEMKFPVRDFGRIQTILLGWHARREEVVEEADHYYNAPDRDFAVTDEALRIRCIGEVNFITYKGPRQGGRQSQGAKTRTEIELPLEKGKEVAEGFCRLLTHLGYRAVAVVRKQREIHHFEREGFSLQVCLDKVGRLGTFVEVEIVAPEEKKALAQEMLLQVTKDLELEGNERRSYLEMFLSLDNP